MRETNAGGVYDWDLDYLSSLMFLVYVVAVAVCFEKNTALSRGWCMPLARGGAVCGAKRIAQHANPGLLF